MADNSILTPGYQEPVENPVPMPESDKHLEKDNYLSEYKTEGEKSVVRENLNIPSKDSVYSKQDVDTQVSEKIRDAIQGYLSMEDPHQILPQVKEMIADVVKTDGSTPFISAQTGVDPYKDQHLTTKKYVDKIIRDHLIAKDPHDVLQEVATMLLQYVKGSEVYNKNQLYTKQEIDHQADQYIKKDGTTPFIKAQIGADPSIDSHLATKRYVDKTIYNHKVDTDPHNFITILNQRLAAYSKRKDVFDKTQTYSRTQLDSIINKLVNQLVSISIQDYQDSTNEKLEHFRKQHYVKSDGTIPFKNPQAGVSATEEYHLATLGQVQNLLEVLTTSLNQKIENKEDVWKTSGPAETTVGFVEDNTPLPETMTLQEICDAIFYGKGICLEVPDYVIITEKCPVTMCIHGSIGLVKYAELYQNDELIHTFQKTDFEDGCVTVDSLPLLEDAEFTFKVYYTNEAVHEVSKLVKCYMPVFVGLLTKWKPGHTITMDYLIQLCKGDTEGTQDRFLNYGKDLTSFTFKYKFEDPELRHPFIVIPADYPSLESMVTKSQSFGLEAFDVIDHIPLTVPGVKEDIIFKVYIYKQALSSLNQDVTFNFTSKEQE